MSRVCDITAGSEQGPALCGWQRQEDAGDPWGLGGRGSPLLTSVARSGPPSVLQTLRPGRTQQSQLRGKEARWKEAGSSLSYRAGAGASRRAGADA